GRLRQKLVEYYRTEGVEDPIVLDLPKGGFRVVFEARKPVFEQVAVEDTSAPATPRQSWRGREIGLAVARVVAIAVAAFFALRSRCATQKNDDDLAPWTPEIQQLWDPILSSNRPLVVCIATPLSVMIPGFGFVREFDVNDWDDVAKSKGIAA